MDSIFAAISAYSGQQYYNTETNRLSSSSSVTESVRSTSNVLIPSQQKSRPLVINFICFSKQRPFQLEQFLVSLERFASSCLLVGTITVLYSSSGYDTEYSELFRRHPTVIAVPERDFASNFIDIVNEYSDLHLHKDNILCFCVDDLIFTSEVPLRDLAGLIRSDVGSDVLCIQMKLHMGVCYSHAGSKACSPPPVACRRRGSSGPSKAAHHIVSNLLYKLTPSNNGDWSYFFDLCCGMYRLADVQLLAQQAVRKYGKESLRNPNVMEYTFNKLINEGVFSSNNYKYCAFPPRCCLKVVTVNRVQSTYNVPIFESEGGDLASLNALSSRFADGLGLVTSMDFSQYDTELSLSVHVGSLHLLNNLPSEGPQVTPSQGAMIETTYPYDVSVVLPVHNGERFIQQCLLSLLDQAQGCTFEVILVDDGSTDGTMEICRAIVRRVQDGDFSVNPMVAMKILSLDRVGLVAALDAGLAAATSEFVARLDADDMCERGRLSRQVTFLRRNPSINVVGGQAILIDSDTLGPTEASADGACADDDEKVEGKIYEIAGCIPTHPALVHWHMLFRCCILHPTSMFRKSIILECGSYSAAETRDTSDDAAVDASSMDAIVAEDYALWLRILDRYTLSIANLPDVVLQLRRHETSKSAIQKEALTLHSRAMRHCAINRLLENAGAILPHSDLSVEFLDVLCSPQKSDLTYNSVVGALRLLAFMFQAFTAMYDCKEEGLVACILESKTQLERGLYLASLVSLGQEATSTVFNQAVEAGLVSSEGLRSYSIDTSTESLKRLIINSLF